jgi:aldehyde:ferredoxin oxidoreductase
MNVGPLSKWGSSVNTVMGVNNGDAPIRNWGGTRRDARSAAKAFNPDRLHERETKKYHCYSCPMGCGSIVDIKDLYGGEFEHTHKPEYETVDAFGPLLLNGSLEAVFYINELLNRAGMDSISAGNTVAYAIECFEKGHLTREPTGGLDLRWGNHPAHRPAREAHDRTGGDRRHSRRRREKGR